MCGGTATATPTPPGAYGLSPRVRGNHPFFAHLGVDAGSIPACAGEPRFSGIAVAPFWVYPRVCGGTLRCRPPLGTLRGLSPRVRGNRRCIANCGAGQRSIPACAGEPELNEPPIIDAGVYPRVCGGTTRSLQNRSDFLGLSPRVRGNRPGSRCRPLLLRSIPACAGEPARPMTPLTPAAVYPRVCGGTALAGSAGRTAIGLSPRVRGNPGDLRGEHRPQGSIPACAGEPSR